MTVASTFDTLAAIRDLEAAGLERAQAEAIAAHLRAAAVADRDDLATKADIAILRRDLDAGLAALDARIGALRVEIRIVAALAFAMAAKMFGLFNAVASVLS